MSEFLYSQRSITIAAVILGLMLLAMHLGCMLGKRAQGRVGEASRSQISTIQGSLLGMLALMLGFTFSIALDRYNGRSQAIVDEVNAIGTTWLRAGLLPEAVRADAQQAIRDYTDLRVRMTTVTGADLEERRALRAQVQRMQDALWAQAVEASRVEPAPATTGLFTQALNGMIDAYSTTVAEVDRHVPELVLLLLYGAFVVSGGIIGFTAGLAGHRPAASTYLMVSLVAMLMLVVLDLDRPGRGIIKVSVQSVLDLQASMARPQ